jgi:beta-lactamase class A
MSVKTFLAVFVMSGFLISCEKKYGSDFEEKVVNELSKNKGTFAIAFRDLSTGETFFMNERERFHAASTMKTPVMVEVFRQAEEGRFSLQDSVFLKNEFKSIVDGSLFSLNQSDDSELALYGQLGKKRTIGDLVYDMIIVSSNLATNIIIEKVNAEKVTATMREIGARDIEVLRGVEDSKAYEKGMNNTTTAYDLMLIFEKIAKNEMVSPEASASMINILLDQRFNEVIPAQLPAGVKVAHKTGNITGVQHDSGIVFLPDGQKYVLVLLSKGMENERSGIASMARVSAMIYNEVVKD